MINYLKKSIQVIVLTVVLVFAALLVINSGTTIQDVAASTHNTYRQHWPDTDIGCRDVWYKFHESYSG